MNLNERLSRSLALHPIPNSSVLVIGAGGIGSNAVHLLVSMGFTNLTVIDFDIVGEENIYPGFFPHVGESPLKTEVLKAWAAGMGVEINTITTNLEEIDELDRHDITILSTDTLSSRLMGMERMRGQCDWFIDARMGGEYCSVFCVPGDSQALMARHMQYLNDEESPLACGLKATAPLTKGYINGMIGQVLYDILNNNEPPYMQRYNLNTGRHTRVEMATLETQDV